jgi:predicted aminopeptidase
LEYYGHLMVGQYRIYNRRQPIAEMVTDPTIPDTLKSKLKFVLTVRTFAENRLHLPAGAHYLNYIDLHRPFAAWNVYAAPEFSLQPKLWRYPIIGAAAYRGFFSEAAATDYARQLASRGYDTHVGGAVAYSTLGWFDDPVFNTMLHRNRTGIAALIFHELAHQLIYVSDDTAFNESFASAVEQEGVRRWLEETGDTQAYGRYLDAKAQRKKLHSRVQACRERLEALYASGMTPARMRDRKALIFQTLREEYRRLQHCPNGDAGTDRRDGATPLNNATLVPFAVYGDYVPAFFTLLQRVGGHLPEFYARCQALAALPKTERERRLSALLDAAAGSTLKKAILVQRGQDATPHHRHSNEGRNPDKKKSHAKSQRRQEQKDGKLK